MIPLRRCTTFFSHSSSSWLHSLFSLNQSWRAVVIIINSTQFCLSILDSGFIPIFRICEYNVKVMIMIEKNWGTDCLSQIPFWGSQGVSQSVRETLPSKRLSIQHSSFFFLQHHGFRSLFLLSEDWVTPYFFLHSLDNHLSCVST